MDNIWREINNKIKSSNIFRFPYGKIIGMSLSKYINKLRLKGYSHEETINIINRHPNIKEFKLIFPNLQKKLEENIQISVCARYGEQNSADKVKLELEGDKDE